MDRESKQKVKLICLIIGVIALGVTVFFCKVISENRIFEEQKKELSTIYPEIADELSENIDYYADKNMRIDILIMVSFIFLTVIVLAVTYFLVISTTKHRLKQVENELNYIYGQQISDLKERLEKEENSTKALITDISHQLKTPLASIKMSHELSLTADFSKEERQSFVETETREILRMETLLDELMKLSRLENSMIQIQCEKCSIKKTISEAVSQIYMKANSKQIDICVDMENDVETLHDHKWTVEALVNILDNALKYSPSETTVNITVSYLVNHVMIEVEDEGIGIPEGELHEIFKRFYRGSNTKKIVKEGAGVGLYLARNIIEQQGGSIVAKRKNGRGSSFQIMLPLWDFENCKTLTKL
ncbi:MAG: sensor histidine kinase [Lachnospiraceae bacterium]